VRHTLTGKPIFMVFDVITMHNQYYGDKTLSERLQIIGKHVVTPYRQAIQEGKIPKEHPFLIMGKVFFPKEKLDKVRKYSKNRQILIFRNIRYSRGSKKMKKQVIGIILTIRGIIKQTE